MPRTVSRSLNLRTSSNITTSSTIKQTVEKMTLKGVPIQLFVQSYKAFDMRFSSTTNEMKRRGTEVGSRKGRRLMRNRRIKKPPDLSKCTSLIPHGLEIHYLSDFELSRRIGFYRSQAND